MIPLDLQVNGFGGVDFNDETITAEDLHRACEDLRKSGAGQILATVITDSIDSMCARLARIVELREADPLAKELITGLHIEGPFLNETPGYIGAHPAEHAKPANPDGMRRLLEAGAGLTRLVTLAPERDPDFATTRMLAQQNITVSAGHCDPSLDDLRGAIDAGLTMFTHLGNGCPMHMHRHDNIVQRGLTLADRLWICFIPDGVHVPFPALRNYVKCAGIERTIMVTDAVSAAGLGPGNYRLAGQDILIGDDGIAWAPDRSHFIGSTVTMSRTLENLRNELELPEHSIEKIVSSNPRKALQGDG